MAYTPNPDREVKDGKAVVSAKELAAFKSQYGENKSLRDLLNMDKGLRRKGEDSAPAIKAPSKTEAAALEAKGLANQKPQQDEEEKALKDAPNNQSSVVAPQKLKPDFTLGNVPTSEQARVNREAAADAVKEVAADVTDYANKPFLSPMMRKADENKGKTYRDMSGKVQTGTGMKRGGAVKKMASGGSVSASRRGDGIAQRGKTRGKMC